MKLNDSIRYLKGIGEKRAELFHKLGVFSIRDLLYHLPRGYEDRTDVSPVADLREGESVCVRVSPAGGIRSFRAKNGARVTQVHMSDGTGLIAITWFNAPYIEKLLRSAEEFILFGKVEMKGRFPAMINPVIEKGDKVGNTTGKIMPIYPCTAGLTQRNIRESVQNALQVLEESIPDVIPAQIREMYSLMTIDDAIQKIHQPDDFSSFEDARRRLAFEEFFVLQIGIGMVKQQKKRGTAPFFSDVKCISDFAKQLPFSLTNAQKRVINEICKDLRRDIPMNRLIQGDVGSGKTIVAAAVMFAAVRSGYQAAMMVPTELLAKQHHKNLSKIFAPWGVQVACLVGGQRAEERRENLQKIADGTAGIIIGTHALITENVTFHRLGLTITDEQHRFGVRQRMALAGKNQAIHTLVMTATPIPRTLSLILYGDLDISIIDELPAGRKKIVTKWVSQNSRKSVDAFVLQQMNEGRQAYFVCPLVEESEFIEANAVEDYLKVLQSGAYRNKKIAAIHGRMKIAEKDEIMAQFAQGKIDGLVSTTVIEVGVDVPNANIMIIENAERFGLSQLHQLRGRVGRGRWQSYCLLFCDGGEVAKQRMKVLCESEDGFEISERDLELRGPGEFLGTRQHGLPQMRVGNLLSDMEILKDAKNASDLILEQDPGLRNKILRNLSNEVNRIYDTFGGVLN